MRSTVGIVVLTALAATPGRANPLDDCTLKNMVGVTSDAAAKFIRQACLGQISVPVPPDQMALLHATAGMGPAQFDNSNHLYITVENNSHYAITEMMVRVSTENGSKSNNYEATNFYQVPKYVVSSLPPDPATYLQIKPFSTVTFSVAIREPSLPQGKWAWDILSAKGYAASQ